MARGTQHIGLQVDWTHEFIGPGSTRHTRHDTLYVDVGNHLAPGVLDAHNEPGVRSSASELIVAHPELVADHLLKPWLDRFDAGQDLASRRWSPTLITHRTPDADGIVGALFCKHLIQTGALPPWAASLASLVTRLDSGEWNPTATPDGLRCVLNVAYAMPDTLSDLERMTCMAALIAVEAEHLRTRVGRRYLVSQDWCGPHCGGWTTQAPHGPELYQTLVDDRKRYKDLFNAGEVTLTKTTLPLALDSDKPTSTRTVPTAIVETPQPSIHLLKHWVRSGGGDIHGPALLTVIRHRNYSDGTSPNDPEVRRRFIVALDQGQQLQRPAKEAVTLRGFGMHLERLERQKRMQHKLGSRTGRPRYPDVTNADPWYDGRDKGHTIVDAPREGTVLDIQDVVTALQSCFWGYMVEADVQIIVRTRKEPVTHAWTNLSEFRAYARDTHGDLTCIRGLLTGHDARVGALLGQFRNEPDLTHLCVFVTQVRHPEPHFPNPHGIDTKDHERLYTTLTHASTEDDTLHHAPGLWVDRDMVLSVLPFRGPGHDPATRKAAFAFAREMCIVHHRLDQLPEGMGPTTAGGLRQLVAALKQRLHGIPLKSHRLRNAFRFQSEHLELDELFDEAEGHITTLRRRDARRQRRYLQVLLTVIGMMQLVSVVADFGPAREGELVVQLGAIFLAIIAMAFLVRDWRLGPTDVAD